MEFEKILVAACVQEQKALKRAVRCNIEHYHFKNETLRYLFKSLKRLAKYPEVNEQVIETYIKHDDSISKDEKALYVQFVKDFSKIDVTGHEFSLDLLKKKAVEFEIKLIISTAGKQALMDDTSYDELGEFIYNKASRLKTLDRVYEEHDYARDWGNRKIEREESLAR